MGDKDSIEIDTEALGQYLDENFSELRARVLGVQTKISNAVNLLVDFQDQIKQKLEHLESAVMTLAQHVVPSEIPKATVKAAMTLIEDSTYAEQTGRILNHCSFQKCFQQFAETLPPTGRRGQGLMQIQRQLYQGPHPRLVQVISFMLPLFSRFCFLALMLFFPSIFTFISHSRHRRHGFTKKHNSPQKSSSSPSSSPARSAAPSPASRTADNTDDGSASEDALSILSLKKKQKDPQSAFAANKPAKGHEGSNSGEESDIDADPDHERHTDGFTATFHTLKQNLAAIKQKEKELELDNETSHTENSDCQQGKGKGKGKGRCKGKTGANFSAAEQEQVHASKKRK